MEIENSYLISWLTRGTSQVDWCEANYTVTPHIAEFINTISNVLFLIIPAACAQLWRSYAHNVSRGIDVVLALFPVIGLSSAYFHATLSLLGQLLDELSILWILMVSYALFTPIKYRPAVVKRSPRAFQMVLAFLGITTTVCAFVKPHINQYALFLTAIPAIYMLVTEVRCVTDRRIKTLGVLNIFTMILAVTVWLTDRFMCDRLSAFNLYFLHGLWHIFIFIGSYNMQVLMCYFHAHQDVPEVRAIIKFWPYDWDYGLPYVQCQSKHYEKCP